MSNKRVFGILAASAVLLLCLAGVAFADDSASQTDLSINGEQPPELPEGEQPPQGDGTQPPEIPEGEQPQQGDGTQPPEIPEGEQPQQGEGTQPPEIPEGEQPPQGEGEQPSEIPENQTSTNQTSAASPVPHLGILVGLGAAIIMTVRHRN